MFSSKGGFSAKLDVLASVLRGSGIKKDYDFDIKDEVGNGRYGIVMQAVDKKTKKLVAVKKLVKKGMNADNLESVKREINIMKKINHCNCIQFHAVYEGKQHTYIVMELVTGGELLDRVIETDRYTETEAAKCFSQIINAVAYLHSIGIVHRDLKPDNILYLNKSADSLIKIADYGLATVFDPKLPRQARPRFGTKCGSASFVAPEVLAGQQGYGEQCDVWSIGCVLYILLSGFLPFDQDSNDSAVMMGTKMPYPVTEKVQFPQPFWDFISKDACHLLTNMLELDPLQRFSAQDVKEHKWLQRWQDGDLPDLDLPSLQGRLKQMRMNAIIGTITTLTAINKMRSDADWEAIHKVLCEEADVRLEMIMEDTDRLEVLKHGFNMLDRDKSGKISLKNLRDLMVAMGKYEDEDALREMMRRFDLFKTGDICFKVYCIMMSQSPHTLTEEIGEIGVNSPYRKPTDYELALQNAFDDMDIDKSGFIDQANLIEVLNRFGVKLTVEEATEMISVADKRGDGVIHKDEFVDFISSYISEANVKSPLLQRVCPTKSQQLLGAGETTPTAFASPGHVPASPVMRDIWGEFVLPQQQWGQEGPASGLAGNRARSLVAQANSDEANDPVSPLFRVI